MNSQSVQGAAKDIVLTRLQELSERKLTLDVLISLIRTFGFEKIEHHGGSYEEGKDIICWRTDELGLVELGVAQVKKYQPTAKSSDHRSFGEIVTQLQQAAERSVPNVDGSTYYPSLIYFITPFPVETRALQSRFEGYSSLRPKRVKIIDGHLLVKLIWKNLPMIGQKLAGTQLLVSDAVARTLTNTDLLSALSTKPRRAISSFYCDLDFAVGNVSTRFFFSLDFTPNVHTLSLTSEDWPFFKRKCQVAESVFGIKLACTDYETIEEDYEKHKAHYVRNLKLQTELSARIDKNLLDLERLEREMIDRVELQPINETDSHNDQLDKLADHYEKVISRLRSYQSKGQNEQDSSVEKWNQLQNIALQSYIDRIKSIEADLFNKHDFEDIVARHVYLQQKNAEFMERRSESAKYTADLPTYHITIDGHELAARLEDKQRWLVSQIEAFNEEEPPMPVLRQFLLECEQLFGQVEEVLESRSICESIGISKEQECVNPAKFKRISLSIHSIFDTGLNIAVFGDAGAGKTTSLQMYAKRRLERNADSDLTIFAPLARVVSSLAVEDESKQKDSPSIMLERGLGHYLRGLGLDLTLPILQDILKQKNMVLLLDGIDEAIVAAPWILDGISELSQRYSQARIVVSSRMSGEYLQQIPFFGITLLPFTDPQRDRFIKNWFGEGEENEKKITRILNHLNVFPHLGEIIRNPLLGTILCVLAHHDVPLPDSEVRLYEERMRLLMGLYDIHKKAVRLKSYPLYLEIVARKLGYMLHQAGMRHARVESLISRAVSALCERIPREKIVLGVTELIDPCNIIVPMTDDGQMGFGHLRYQEYLAACELINNRGIAVGPLMIQSWWRGALILFAQMTDEIEFLLDWVVKHRRMSSAYDTLVAMLKVRPQKEWAALREIIDGHLTLDYFEVEKLELGRLEIGGGSFGPEEFDEETMELLSALEIDDSPELE